MPYWGGWTAAIVGALGLTSAYAATKLAEQNGLTVFDRNGLTVTLGAAAAAAYFNTWDTNFGSGRVDFRTGANTGDAEWGEGYLKSYLEAVYAAPKLGQFYSGIGGVAAVTLGSGDAGGFTTGGDGNIDEERLYIGWRSGKLLTDSEEELLDLSYGRQEFHVGDGFLIWDGNLDQLDKGALWLTPRLSFERAGLVRINTHPVRGDLFYLQSDADQDNTELAGVDLEYFEEGVGTLGLMYFHIFDSTPTFFGPRAGMNVVDLRVNEARLPFAPNWSFWGEYVIETGNGTDGRIDANGWYVEADYSRSDWRWSPILSYRYAFFSGGEIGDTTRRDFDPLFYGFSRGWGTWFQGEITGEYLLFNSNQVNHKVQVELTPLENLAIGAIYYKFWLAEKNYFGTPVSDNEFDDEINLYANWVISDQVSLSVVYGAAFPGPAARQAFGDDKVYQLIEMGIFLSY